MWSLGVQGAWELLPVNHPWLNRFSRFGHQVGASAQDLRLGNRFLWRGYRSLERMPPRNWQEGGGHPARNMEFGWLRLQHPLLHELARVGGWREG